MARDAGERGRGEPQAFFDARLGELIAHVRHEARLAQTDKDGVPLRAHLAASRNAGTRALLDGPECPEALEYLRDWAYALHGRSGVGMAGVAPLTPTTVRDWALLNGVEVLPHEYEALVILDAVLGHPGESDPAPAEAPRPAAQAWPTKKVRPDE